MEQGDIIACRHISKFLNVLFPGGKPSAEPIPRLKLRPVSFHNVQGFAHLTIGSASNYLSDSHSTSPDPSAPRLLCLYIRVFADATFYARYLHGRTSGKSVWTRSSCVTHSRSLSLCSPSPRHNHELVKWPFTTDWFPRSPRQSGYLLRQ